MNKPAKVYTLTLSDLCYSMQLLIINCIASIMKSFCLYSFSDIDGYILEMYGLISLSVDFSECIPINYLNYFNYYYYFNY